jgi:hypothetical protein
MRLARAASALLPLLLAATPSSVRAGEPVVTAGPQIFRVRIENGSAEATSAPTSLALTAGWKQPCVLEIENRDAVRRVVSLKAAPPIRVVLPDERIVLEPDQVRAVPFLMQTLVLDGFDAQLTLGGDVPECHLRVRIEPRQDSTGVRFGIVDHFEREGPILGLSGASSKPKSGPTGKPPKKKAGSAGKPPKLLPNGEPEDRWPRYDRSDSVAAFGRESGERALDAMPAFGNPGSPTSRVDVHWSPVEPSSGSFTLDWADGTAVAERSRQGYESEPEAGAAAKPPKASPNGAPADRPSSKDLSRLTAAPSREIGERVLAAMRLIQDLGTGTYRMDVSWSLVEQSPGVFSWDRTDWMVDAIRSRKGADSRLVAQIGYQPAWLPRDFPTTSEGRQAYSRWVESVVSRYADRVDFWEIWNEPLLYWLRHPDHNPTHNSPPREPLSAQATDALAASYAPMILEVIRSASGIIRQRDPGATILSPGFEDFFNAPERLFADFARNVYTRLLAAGMSQYVDGFCVHSYPAGYPGKAPELRDTKAWAEFDRAADAGRLLQMLRQHEVHLPLYSTEFGGFQLPKKASKKDETAAALALLRNGCILAHQGFRLVTYYELYDWDQDAMTYLVRYEDRRRTRGFLAYQKLILSLTGATGSEVPQIPQARILDSDYSGLVVKAFRRGSEDILCLWNNASKPRAVRLRSRESAAGEAPLWEHLRFTTKKEFIQEETWGVGDAKARDVELTVAPLEFHVLSRTSSSVGFEWLAGFDVLASKK